jgi:hypothetical protein
VNSKSIYAMTLWAALAACVTFPDLSHGITAEKILRAVMDQNMGESFRTVLSITDPTASKKGREFSVWLMGKRDPGSLSVQEAERILRLCTEKGISLVDISVAGINRAIDEWNGARDVTPGILTTSISVNMKGRFQGFKKANNSAVMVFKSRPEERRDPDAFAPGMAFIAVVENSVSMRQYIGFIDRHSRVRGNPVFSRVNGNP